jgi:hypothetical protein
MKVHKNNPAIRLIGSLVALGFLVMGLYAIFGAAPELPEVTRDRAFWFGITCIVAAVFALPLSWLIKDITGVWCAPPRRNIFGD